MSPCCAYAVALDAENTMTSPIPTSAATDVKSTTSNGAGAYAGNLARGFEPAARNVAKLCTCRLPQCGNRRGEALAAIVGGGEHIERRAPGREQHDVAGRRDLACAMHRLLHRPRRNAAHASRGLENFVRGLADGDQRLGAPANFLSHRFETAALRASAGDQHDRRFVTAERRDDRRRSCGLRIVIVADAVDLTHGLQPV